MVAVIQLTVKCRKASPQMAVRRGITAQLHSQCLLADNDAFCYDFKRVPSSSPRSQAIGGNRHPCQSLMHQETNALSPDSLVPYPTTTARHGNISAPLQMTAQIGTSKRWMDGPLQWDSAVPNRVVTSLSIKDETESSI